MSTGSKFGKSVGIGVLCLGLTSAFAASEHGQRKPKKPALPPLPVGPTGPVPQIPLDSITPIAPQVSYQNGQLTIVAANSTLGDILRAVKKQTGADIEIPAATDRVVTHLGPGPARDVMAELLNGSRFNYVLLGSPEDASLLTRVVLVAKSPDTPNPNNNIVAQQPIQQQPGMMQPGMQANMAPPPQEMAQDQSDADQAADDNADDPNADQAAAEAEQQQQQQQMAPDQPGVKTPQQMLQEMQQRQMQLQQAQPPGQPPIPGPGVPVRPPQEP
jgi:hypothetical protein